MKQKTNTLGAVTTGAIYAGMLFDPQPTRIEKIKNIIHRCIEMDLEVPMEWLGEYNASVSLTKSGVERNIADE
jgi:hypothetical protein